METTMTATTKTIIRPIARISNCVDILSTIYEKRHFDR